MPYHALNPLKIRRERMFAYCAASFPIGRGTAEMHTYCGAVFHKFARIYVLPKNDSERVRRLVFDMQPAFFKLIMGLQRRHTH